MRRPDGVQALLFDMDGVLTDTAKVHAQAWKETFDEVIDDLGAEGGPFRLPEDYEAHVDGKPRQDGVRDFLASRGVELPEGEPDDPPDARTVRGIGNRKNEKLLALLDRDGVDVFEDGKDLLRRARDAGLRTGLVTSSANAHAALEAAGIPEDLFDAWVDGTVIESEHLKGKPAPDSFVRAAELCGLTPQAAAIFEDALSGVRAGRAGGFGLVVGVDRTGHGAELTCEGADVVLTDLHELEV